MDIVNVSLVASVALLAVALVEDVNVNVNVDIEQITRLWTFRDNNKSAPVVLNVIVAVPVAVAVDVP